MPYINGGLVRVGRPPPRGKFKAMGDAIKASPRARGARNKASAAFGNAVSKPAHRGAKGKGGSYGRPSSAQTWSRRDQKLDTANAAVGGLLTGAIGGSFAGGN